MMLRVLAWRKLWEADLKFSMGAGVFVALAMTGWASAETAPTAPMTPPTLMIDRGELHAANTLHISSTDFAAGDPIPLADSGYAGSRSPPLSIAGAPRATRSYVLLMEDPDAQYRGEPILHWFAYNLPGEVTAIPGGLPAGALLTAPVRLNQGANITGKPAYFGPRPPPRAPLTHHYHIEVFALDAMLPDGLADRTALAAAMSGHLLAEGQLQGTYTAPQKPAG
jgi:Raf kinase inhibitor-like YbhB/YbcL family protein